MKFKRNKPPAKIPRDSERLIELAAAAIGASAFIERAAWRREISALVNKLIEGGNDQALDVALDLSFSVDPLAHELLAEETETAAESMSLTIDGGEWDALLFAIPIVAWSKYSVPVGELSSEAIAPLIAHLHGHVLSRDARMVLVPYLHSVDTIPPSFSNTRKLTHKLALAAINSKDAPHATPKDTETFDLLADSRFLIGAIAVAKNEPMFRWQEKTSTGKYFTRAESALRWEEQNRENVARLLPGCTVNFGVAEGFFSGCRAADRNVRAASVQAGVAYVEGNLKLAPGQLRAVVAGIGEGQIDEYRVSLLLKNQPEVLYGIVWPLYGAEDEDGDEDTPASMAPLQAIREVLKAGAVVELRVHEQRIVPDYCEDCGAPLFPDLDAELVHAEMPEDSDSAPVHYH